MPATWRSSAAQVFVAGRIAKIDDYWAVRKLTWDIFFIIEEWDLWDVAFPYPKMANDVKRDWKAYQAGPTFRDKLFGSKRTLGADIINSVESNVVTPLQQLFENSRLTINFNGNGWFGAQAGFPEYKSMWDRLKDNVSLNVSKSAANPADVRAKADRWALYGQFGKADTKAAMTGMNLPHVKKTDPGQGVGETFFYSPKKAKVTDSQVFAALNYGHRQHGSNIGYGQSYFELDDDFKKEAIFFAMDTFTPLYGASGIKTKAQRSKLYQISAGAFGGAILLAIKSQYDENPSNTNKTHSIELAKDLLQAARNGAPKEDTNENHLMIEAHIFREVKMARGCINRVFLSKKELSAAPNASNHLQAFTQQTGITHHYIP